MKEIAERLKNSTTPKGWKKVRNIAGIVTAVGLFIVMSPVEIPDNIQTWITYIITVSGSVSGTSHFTKK